MSTLTDFYTGSTFPEFYVGLRKPVDVHIGSTINEYFVERELGKGAQGTLYIGHHIQDPDAKLAIKMVRYPKHKQRQMIEFHRVSQILKHPNVREICNTFVVDEGLWAVMELLEGNDLETMVRNYDARFKTCSPLECEKDWTKYIAWCREVLRGILQGLSYMHSQGVIHYDIKLANVVYTNSGEVKIIDLGLARIDPQDIVMQGTPNYIAPEIVYKEHSTYKADIWSLGILAFYMLKFRMPWDTKTSPTLLYREIKASLAPRITSVFLGAIPMEITTEVQDFIDVIHRALVKDPNDRASAEELLAMPFFS